MGPGEVVWEAATNSEVVEVGSYTTVTVADAGKGSDVATSGQMLIPTGSVEYNCNKKVVPIYV